VIAQLVSRRTFDVGCTVEVSHKFESLHAHVDLDGNLDIYPGDRVLVHGEPINPPYGEAVTERRQATVTRASWPERLLTRFTGNFECVELLDVSFSDRRQL